MQQYQHQSIDYLILGQGIAGTILDFQARKMGKKTIVINQPNPESASRVSAGLINPITGRKFVKSWMMDQLLPAAIEAYQGLTELLGINFFEPQPIIRALATQKDENNWMVRSSIPSYLPFVKDYPDLGVYKNALAPAYGYGEVIGGGRVQVESLLTAYANYLTAQNAYLQAAFEYDKIIFTPSGIIYKNIHAQRIIFCEGFGVTNNPYFNHLPVQGNKGEVLIVRIPDLAAQKITKQGVFLVPLNNANHTNHSSNANDGLFWVGSTYFKAFEDAQPSELGKATLLEKLEKILRMPFEVVQHRAAIRPTVPDRRPLIGVHEAFKQLVLFNGMGTKGASIAPYWSKRLLACLENHTPIDEVVSLLRYAN